MDLFRRLINKFYTEKKICAPSSSNQIDCIPHLPEIISILNKNSLDIRSTHSILIGSRAARFYLPNIRLTSNENNIDWDIICSSQYLVNWLHNKVSKIKSIEMITPTANDKDFLDYYVYCILDNDSKYDFSIPQSSESYTAYLLNNWTDWIRNTVLDGGMSMRTAGMPVGSAKLLLILKKFMLYYPYQWFKTAKDYRQLLTITGPLTEKNKVLCDLFFQYNEKVHGYRPANSDRFVINSSNTQNGTTIERDTFFQQEKHQQLALIYHTAMSIAISGDILTGLEKICTGAPLWLADFVLDNWLAIHQQKLNQKMVLPKAMIEFQIDNYRLFPDIPELALQCILYHINDASDFYSMKFVCKRWYVILCQDEFWRALYSLRFGKNTVARIENVRSWKMMYFLKLEREVHNNQGEFQHLVDASLQLRQTKPTDVIQLWEDWTYEEQAVDSDMFSKLNYILSNSLCIQLNETSKEYIAKWVVFGLDDSPTRTSVNLILRIGECGNSRHTYYMEECLIELISIDDKRRSLKFCGPELFGYYCGCWDYAYSQKSLLKNTSSALCSQFPSGLVICLFVMLTHPAHRGQFIQYLNRLEKRLVGCREYW